MRLSSLVVVEVLLATAFCSSGSLATKANPQSQQSAEVLDILKNSGLVSRKGISKEQQKQLEGKITETLKKLYSIERKKGDFLFPKDAITGRLKKAGSFTEASKILESIQKEAVPAPDINISKVEQDLKTQKSNAQASMIVQQIDQDTNRVMKESFIATSKLLTDSGRKVIREKIRVIVEKYYKKEIPNLTQQDPITVLINLLKSPKSQKDVEDKLNKFNQDIQKYNEKYVAPRKEAEKKSPAVVPISDQVRIEDHLLVGYPTNIDSLISGFKSGKDDSKRALKLNNNPGKVPLLQKLVSSTSSGFMVLSIIPNSKDKEVVMKLFTIENYRGKDMLVKSNVKTVFYKFFVSVSQSSKLDRITQGYEFWHLNGSFFAIPKNKSQAILSLSHTKSRFTGSVIRDVLKAVSTMK